MSASGCAPGRRRGWRDARRVARAYRSFPCRRPRRSGAGPPSHPCRRARTSPWMTALRCAALSLSRCDAVDMRSTIATWPLQRLPILFTRRPCAMSKRAHLAGACSRPSSSATIHPVSSPARPVRFQTVCRAARGSRPPMSPQQALPAREAPHPDDPHGGMDPVRVRGAVRAVRSRARGTGAGRRRRAPQKVGAGISCWPGRKLPSSTRSHPESASSRAMAKRIAKLASLRAPEAAASAAPSTSSRGSLITSLAMRIAPWRRASARARVVLPVAGRPVTMSR